MAPIALLSMELSILEKDLRKSKMSRFNGKISQETHTTHRKNLLPKIRDYKLAIKKLKS